MVINWPSIESRNYDYESAAINESPYSEVKAEYDKKVYALSDWLERARHYAQAKEKGSPANFERDLKLEALVPVVEGKLAGARGGANSPRHPQFRRILQQAKFENDFGRRHRSVASKRSAEAEKNSRDSRPDHERAG